jgi:acetyltransferase
MLPAMNEPRATVLPSAPYRPLDFFFNPKTVAVVGATDKIGSVGRAVLENLRGFGGSVFPVNPKRAAVLGIPAFPTVAAVPAKVDLAIIVTPAATVPALIRECVSAGVKGAIILSAGFKECGEEGAALEREVLAEARRGGLRIIGPNCLGVMAPHSGLNATFAAALARPGNIAFISQSGALCTAILGWSFQKNVGFSAFVSVGSMLDVGWGDLIYHLGSDPHTHSIVIYMESIGDARSFLSAAREVAFTKPIIVIKVGRTEAAAKAAASHTGALTGSDEVLAAALRRVGVLRVETIEELFNLAHVVSKQPLPRGPRLAIVTNAGGPGALALDMLVASGGQPATLADGTLAALNQFLPAPWSHGNPVDILGDADAGRYAQAVDLVVKDPNCDGMLVILTPQAMTNGTATAAGLRSSARVEGKPVLASWMGGAEEDAGRYILTDLGVPVFDYPDTAARAFAYMWNRSSNLRSLYETPALSALSDEGSAARHRTAQLIGAARRAGRTLLTEHEAKEIVSAYGIPTVETRVALTRERAVAEADRLGYPVAVKLHSETITHKTDVGGVILNVKHATGVAEAWRQIEKAVREKAGAEHFQGVTVQRMAPRDGYELILGSSIDSQFGPVLLFGAGGQLVEVFKDRALALPPLTATLARRLMEETKILAALKGVRGRPAVDLAALEQLLVRFSQLVAEQPRIKEVDINPLLASPGGLVALDARIILHEAALGDADLPKLAIRPYPIQYVTAATLSDGQPVTIRPIRPEDEPLLVKFHQTLSSQSVYNRYFEALQLEQRTAHERLARLCFIDYDREIALVVEQADRKTGTKSVLGVGRLSKLFGGNDAEFALIIGDPWQAHGLGTRLLQMLVQIARDEGLARVTGSILPDNFTMKELCRRVGFRLEYSAEDGAVMAELVL